MQFQNRKRLIFFVVLYVVIACLIFGAFSLTGTKRRNQKKADAGQYYDPNSKETVSSPKDKSPETYGSDNNPIVYLGFSKLLDTGTSLDQIDSIKLAVKNFSDNKKLNITEASITVDRISAVGSRDDTEDMGVDFPLLINRSTVYDIKVRYVTLDTVSFQAYKSNQLVYEFKPPAQSEDTVNDSTVD